MLFGHQDTTQPSAPAASAVSVSMTGMPQDTTPDTNPLATDPQTGISLPVTTGDAPHDTEAPASILNQPAAPSYSAASPVDNDPAPTTPFGSPQAASAPAPDAPPVTDHGAPIAHLTPAFSDQSAAALQPPAAPDSAPEPPQADPAPVQSFVDYSTAQTPASTLAADDADLMELKRQALTELGPLVGELDQSPEDTFRTTMMLVQSTDNASLLKQAYAAAQSIPDEKSRAQALLDLVNEINYFTQAQQPAVDDQASQTM